MNAITNAELIVELQKLSPDAVVYTCDGRSGIADPLSSPRETTLTECEWLNGPIVDETAEKIILISVD